MTGPQPAAWKVPHPPYEQLVREVAEAGHRAVGRRYGVSDNAIRKWLRATSAPDAGGNPISFFRWANA